MFFATILRGQTFLANALRTTSSAKKFTKFRVLTVDVDHTNVQTTCDINNPGAICALRDPDIEVMTSSSTAPAVAERIKQLQMDFPGKMFAILDSLHTAKHVKEELDAIFPLLRYRAVPHCTAKCCVHAIKIVSFSM